MYNFWPKYRIAILAFVFLVFFFVVILIIICSIDHSYFLGFENKISPNTTYSSSDWIGFWGSLSGGLFGAIITIFGVYWTIENNRKETEVILQHNRKMNEELISENRALSDEDSRKNILPVIVINKLLTKYEGNFLTSLMAVTIAAQNAPTSGSLIPIENNIQYKESELESLYFIISREKIDISSELTQEQVNSIEHNWKRGVRFGDRQLDELNISYIPCFVTNCGNGAAINTTFNLKREGNVDFETANSIPVNLKKDADFRLGFFCYLSEETYGNYSLNIEYYDIHGEKYSQNHQICIDHEKATITSKIDQIHHVEPQI